MLMTSLWISGIALLLTFSIFLSHVIYKTGHLAARVEILESWKGNIRNDMHEVSDKLEVLAGEVRELRTLIAERTHQRRSTDEH